MRAGQRQHAVRQHPSGFSKDLLEAFQVKECRACSLDRLRSPPANTGQYDGDPSRKVSASSSVAVTYIRDSYSATLPVSVLSLYRYPVPGVGEEVIL